MSRKKVDSKKLDELIEAAGLTGQAAAALRAANEGTPASSGSAPSRPSGHGTSLADVPRVKKGI